MPTRAQRLPRALPALPVAAVLLAVALLQCATVPAEAELPPPLPAAPRLPLGRVKLPPGFSISLYSPYTHPARFMALGQADSNTTVVFVSSTEAGVVSDSGRLARC